MRTHVSVILALSLLAVLPAAADPLSDLDLLVSWMTGSFSSRAQAEADQDFWDIRLRMTPIWTDRSDGHWLYVEQAAASSLDQPYRQRVYHVVEVADGLFESSVMALPEPSMYVGDWRREEPLADLEPADLLDREGCSILMRRRGDAFIGGTLGRLCTSSLRGASYATSEVVITAEGVVSWDRGYDDSHAQVWGAVKAGYVFDRLNEEPEAPAAAPESAGEAPTGGSDEE